MTEFIHMSMGKQILDLKKKMYLSELSALLEKSATWNPFCPVFRTLGEKGSQKGSLHVQEPKKFPYITKNYSKD